MTSEEWPWTEQHPVDTNHISRADMHDNGRWCQENNITFHLTTLSERYAVNSFLPTPDKSGAGYHFLSTTKIVRWTFRTAEDAVKFKMFRT